MSPLSRPSAAAVFALAAVAGCASSKPATAPAPAAVALSVPGTITATTPDSVSQQLRGVAPGATRVRSDRSVLSRDEIRATQFPTMYDVVLSLRGNWVRIRAADSFGKSSLLQVYLDQQRLSGGVDELRQMNPTNVESVRFFDPIAASARWGLDHGAGALLITTLSRPSCAAVFALAAAAGCASSEPAPAPAPAAVALSVAGTITATTPDSVSQRLRGVAPGATRVRSDRSVLSRDEIRATQFPTMYDVVLSLRGNWVRKRTADSFGKSSVLQVYLDQRRLSGGVDELRQMNPTNVESVRFFDPIAASARWGVDHGAGALLITTSMR